MVKHHKMAEEGRGDRLNHTKGKGRQDTADDNQDNHTRGAGRVNAGSIGN